MNKKKKQKKNSSKKAPYALKDVLSLYSKLIELKKDVSQVKETGSVTDNRLTDLEIHMNLLTRLLTTLCVEKLGIRVGALKSMVRRIEKEAVRDSQIMELESLYNLPQANPKKASPESPKAKDDPWDKIS
ncbi:MAG TPA: hypothetical protein PLO78_02110 [Candidatus Omnitrophota bacterium]|nr:hypothetical protein [Candidatus Omnitrophota bacterium]